LKESPLIPSSVVVVLVYCFATLARARHENSGVGCVGLIAAGLSAEQILEETPDLEMDDLKAALLYASRKLNHPVLIA
jgi:hypothetical protein